MKTKRLIVTILLVLPFCLRMLGCTVMIVAASATEDGRPVLFKNRDSANAYMVDIRIDHQEGFKFIAQYALREDSWEGLSVQNQGQRIKQDIGCWDIGGRRQSNPPSYRGIVIYNQRKYLK